MNTLHLLVWKYFTSNISQKYQRISSPNGIAWLDEHLLNPERLINAVCLIPIVGDGYFHFHCLEYDNNLSRADNTAICKVDLPHVGIERSIQCQNVRVWRSSVSILK